MGMKLSAQDTISVADSGYVALFHNPTGKVIEFTYKGLYGLKETNREFNLVSGPPLCTYEELSLMMPSSNSVFVNWNLNFNKDVYFSMLSNYPCYVFRERIKLEWICSFGFKNSFKLELIDFEREEVLFDTLVVNTSEILFDFEAITSKLKKDEEDNEQGFRLLIKVENEGVTVGGDMWIKFYDQYKAQKKLYEFINKARAFYSGRSAIENYVLGVIYGREKLFPNAFHAYKKAHQLAPHVKIFRHSYIQIGQLPGNTK
jgi:hypothetical protein